MTMAIDSDTDIEDESSAAEAQELLSDQLYFERKVQEAYQAEDSELNYYRDSGTDEEMPILVGRMKDDASSDDSSSNGSYPYHTDNDNSSIKDSDDDSTTVPGL